MNTKSELTIYVIGACYWVHTQIIKLHFTTIAILSKNMGYVILTKKENTTNKKEHKK